MTTRCQIGLHPSSTHDCFPFSCGDGEEGWWGFDHNDSCFASIKLVPNEHYDSLASDNSPHLSVSALQLSGGEVTRGLRLSTHNGRAHSGFRRASSSLLGVMKHVHNPHLSGFRSAQARLLCNPSYWSFRGKKITKKNTFILWTRYCKGSANARNVPLRSPFLAFTCPGGWELVKVWVLGKLC